MSTLTLEQVVTDLLDNCEQGPECPCPLCSYGDGAVAALWARGVRGLRDLARGLEGIYHSLPRREAIEWAARDVAHARRCARFARTGEGA